MSQNMVSTKYVVNVIYVSASTVDSGASFISAKRVVCFINIVIVSSFIFCCQYCWCRQCHQCRCRRVVSYRFRGVVTTVFSIASATLY